MTQLPLVSPHALARLAERFGVGSEAEAIVFALRIMRESRECRTQLGRRYDHAPRIAWVADDVVLVTDGPEVITAYTVTPLQRDCLLYELDYDDGRAA
jgi:hypothetical protein